MDTTRNTIDLKDITSELNAIKGMVDSNDEHREQIIKLSRDITRPSKHAIHSLHRDDDTKASELLETARASIEKAHDLLESSDSLTVGAYAAGLEEYVEAKSYQLFLKEKRLPSRKDLGLDFEIPHDKFVLGLCDLPGELARKAVLYAIDERYEEIEEIHEVVEQLLELLLEFDFRTGEYRKKVESIKYQLTKVQDILYDVKMKQS